MQAYAAVPALRKATRDDVPRLAAVLARSFADDPVMLWVFRASGSPVSWSERFFRVRLAGLLRQDEVYTTDDVAGGALWAQPERWRPRARELLAYLPLVSGIGRHLLTVMRGLDQLERAHPKPPHYYLAVLGTDPQRQGEGIGSKLMKPVLDDCDANEIPAYLESSKERNVDFYARHGFRVTEEVRLPEGPPVWLMWRDPV